MPGQQTPKPPPILSHSPPCTNLSCGRVREVEDKTQRCRRCKSCYCSRGCRKSDTRRHKRICKYLCEGVIPPTNNAKLQQQQPARHWVDTAARWSPKTGLEAPVSVPFTQLWLRSWLHTRPANDVYRILIDSYRLRMFDDLQTGGAVDPDSVYGGHPTGLPAFRSFLDLACSREGLMPSWWSDWRRADCEQMALQTDEPKWHRLCAKLDDVLVVEHYADPTFAYQLRVFAKIVYGTSTDEAFVDRVWGEMVFAEQLMHKFGKE